MPAPYKAHPIIPYLIFAVAAIFLTFFLLQIDGRNTASGTYPLYEPVNLAYPTPYPMGEGNNLPASWDEDVIAAIGIPGETSEPEPLLLGEGHLGWDKATGQRLDDPTIHPGGADPQFETLEADKLQLLDSSQLIYPSGYHQPVQPGLDAAWREEINASGAPVYGVIQFKQPFDTGARVELENAGVSFYNYVEGGGLYCLISANVLPLLQELHEAGRVLYAGPLPPEAKLSAALAEEIQSLAPDARINVEITLFASLSDAQRQELSQWVSIEDEASSETAQMYLIQGSVEVQYIPDLLSFPVIRWIDKVTVRSISPFFPAPALTPTPPNP